MTPYEVLAPGCYCITLINFNGVSGVITRVGYNDVLAARAAGPERGLLVAAAGEPHAGVPAGARLRGTRHATW